MLLSGDEQGESRLTLPTVGHINNVFPEGSGFLPQALCQKITIISDGCAIAWAGSWLVARIVINRIAEACAARTLTADEIIHLIVTDDDFVKDQHRTAILGWVVGAPDENGKFTMEQFHINGTPNGAKWPDTIISAGSGETLLTQLIERTSVGRANREMHNNVWIAATAIGLLSRLYQMEYLAQDKSPTLTQYFGGGFECAFWNEQRFEKVADFTLILWEAEVGEGSSKLGMPALVVRQVYLDGFLFVRSARFLARIPGRDTEMVAEMHLNCIPPMIAGKARPPLTEIDVPFQSTFIATIVWIVTPHGPMFYHAAEGTEKVIIDEAKAGGISLEFNGDYLDNLVERVERAAQHQFNDPKLSTKFRALEVAPMRAKEAR